VDEVLVTDIDRSAAERVCEKIGDAKLRSAEIDATDAAAVASAAAGAGLVFDFVMPWMACSVMEGALRAGSHYVNTAFDEPYWSDLLQGRPLSLTGKFEEAGLTALLGCGMAPGFINVLIRKHTDMLDVVDSIKIRIAKGHTGGGAYDDIFKPWNPGWAPIQALKDCADRAMYYQDGACRFAAPYSGVEEWVFAAPLGKKLVTHHSHEEPYSLPRTIGKGLKYCDFKYYLSYHPAALVSLGLASEEEIDVKGVKVKPIDVCAAVLPKAGNAFLEEDPSTFSWQDGHVFMDMVAEVSGEKAGEEITFVISCPKMTSPAQAIYDLFGTSLVNVALPAVVGGRQITEGAKKGVIFAEELDPDRFIDDMKATGYPYRWTVTRK
jgi:saccharopine dehydrogenase-like NADP-dependent oxidoreductase